MKIYIIMHCYDVDGGFGDAVYQEDPMFATTEGEKARQYVEKYDKPVIYSRPYDPLYHHGLCIREMDLQEPNLDKNPWEGCEDSAFPEFEDDEDWEED